MALKRKELRDQLHSLLNDQTLAEERVFKSRVRPTWADLDLPAILIYTDDEPCEIRNDAPRLYERRLMVNLEIQEWADENVEDKLDAIEQQVLLILANDHTINDKVEDVVLRNSSMTFSEDGERPIASIVMRIEMPYLEDWSKSEDLLTELQKVSVEHYPDFEVETKQTIELWEESNG